jgi:hypothetical protein
MIPQHGTIVTEEYSVNNGGTFHEEKTNEQSGRDSRRADVPCFDSVIFCEWVFRGAVYEE